MKIVDRNIGRQYCFFLHIFVDDFHSEHLSINQNICPAYMSINHTKPKLKPTKFTPKSPYLLYTGLDAPLLKNHLSQTIQVVQIITYILQYWYSKILHSTID